MFTNAKALVVIVSCALVAHAQSVSGSSTTATAPASQSSLPAGLDACIITCSSQAAASSGCSSYTDLPCVCTSTTFQEVAGACLQANCTTADIQAAQAIQQQECAALSTGNASASTAASTTTSKGTSSSASATHSATSSSAAMALSAPFSLGSLVGTLVASAGALVGAAFVL